MDCFGRNFECLYGCDLSCIAFTEIITATSMLTLRLRDCSACLAISADSLLDWCCESESSMENHRNRLPGWGLLFFLPSSEVSEVPVFSLLSLWLFICCWTTSHLCAIFLWAMHAVPDHSYVEMMQRAVCCSSSQGTQSSGFLMVSQLPDVASEMFILSAVWFPALTVTSRINCMIAYSTHRRVD